MIFFTLEFLPITLMVLILFKCFSLEVFIGSPLAKFNKYIVIKVSPKKNIENF